MLLTILSNQGAAPPQKFWVKVAGVWKLATAYIKISGVWKVTTPFVKVSGAWK
jgi:hypothetical protein